MSDRFLEKFKKGARNFFKNPASFLIRQIYRIVFILPFEFIVSAVFMFPRHKMPSDKQPSSFCFLVTSVIYPIPGKKVTYGSARSVFGPDDRAKQTLRTIESIRAKAPGATVVLIEAGLKGDLPFDLQNKADQYLYLGDKKLVRLACDSRFKSLGETTMLLYAAKFLKKDVDFYFKISGRYFLDDDFDINAWREGQFILYFLQDDYISTRLYGFRKEMMGQWKRALIKGLPFSLIGYAIEHTLAKFIPKKYVRRINKMGVAGISATNDLMKE